jgi:hypothetical protein
MARPRMTKSMRTCTFLSGSALIGLLMVATACGRGQMSSSPVSPSAPSTGGTSLSGSAVISGTLAGVQSSNSAFHPASSGLTVTITGTNISATVVPGGTFVLNGVPSGNVELHFTGPGVDATVTISDVVNNETIHIVVTVNGSRADVSVTDRETPNSGTELEGLITSIDPPSRTLVISGTTVSVPVTATIRHGDQVLTLADLRLGQRVHVKGTVSGSTVVASEVMLQDENPKVSQLEGIVSSASGTCPSLAFTVDATKVTTTASTQVKDASCSQVVNGVRVHVEGILQADGSIVASSVDVQGGHGGK